MRIQLWSYNYDPEPTGIAPLSGVWARAMRDRGHDVTVVAAHPHYPTPAWGVRLRPYRQCLDGVPVLRLPLWPGRDGTFARLRQEATFAGALAASSPLLPPADVIVAVSPSFPALLPTMLFARARRTPWVLWLQDILPDGAAVTGLLKEGVLLDAMRRLELLAYRQAARIAVISDSFRRNLAAKGVPDGRMVRLFNPASRPVRDAPRPQPSGGPPTVLTMGNVGHTQNLRSVVEAFQDSSALEARGARLVIAGDGAAGDEVRAAIRTDRVRMTGVVDSPALERELLDATVGLVSQHYQGVDFNVPSKLMNFMAYGLATVAVVRGDSEVARIVGEARAGWFVDAGAPERLGDELAAILDDEAGRRAREQSALRWARAEVEPSGLAARWDELLGEVVSAD